MNSNVAFEYNLNSMSPQNSMSPPWEGPTGEQGIYGRNAQDSTLPYSFGSYGFDSSTFAFDELSAGGMGMMDPSPPSENFTASGLPFRGLDFIRNYTTDGYLGDQAGWQTFDTGAFIHDPDMLFSLSHESNGDGQAFSNGGSNWAGDAGDDGFGEILKGGNVLTLVNHLFLDMYVYVSLGLLISGCD
jgi:hypothetical protein